MINSVPVFVTEKIKKWSAHLNIGFKLLLQFTFPFFALMPEVNFVFFHLLHFLCRKDSSVKPSLLHFLQDYLNSIN